MEVANCSHTDEAEPSNTALPSEDVTQVVNSEIKTTNKISSGGDGQTSVAASDTSSLCNILSPDGVTTLTETLSPKLNSKDINSVPPSNDFVSSIPASWTPCTRCHGSGVEPRDEDGDDKKSGEREPFKNIAGCYNYLVETLKKVVVICPSILSDDGESSTPGLILLEKSHDGVVILRNSLPKNLFQLFMKEQENMIDEADVKVYQESNPEAESFSSENQSTLNKNKSRSNRTKKRTKVRRERTATHKSLQRSNNSVAEIDENKSDIEDDSYNFTNNIFFEEVEHIKEDENNILGVSVEGVKTKDFEKSCETNERLKVEPQTEKLNYCPVCEEDCSSYACKQMSKHKCSGFRCVKTHIGRHLYWDEERGMIYVDRSTHGEGKTVRDTLKKLYRVRRKKVMYNHVFDPGDQQTIANDEDFGGKKETTTSTCSAPADKSFMDWIGGASDLKYEDLPFGPNPEATNAVDKMLSQNSHQDENVFQNVHHHKEVQSGIDDNPQISDEKPSGSVNNKSCKDQMNEQILLHEVLNQTFSKFDDMPYTGDLFQEGEFVYKCSICSLGYLRSSELTAHREFHPDQKTEYDKTRMILLPQKNKYILKKIQKCCDLCGQIFKGRGNQNFKDHILLHENPNAFQCDICHTNLSTSTGLKYHKLKHFKDKNRTALERAGYLDDKSSYICEICGKSFGQKYKLNLHERTAHGGETIVFPCNFCDKTYKSKEAMYLHRRKMHPQTMMFACDFCGATFLTERKLNMHVQNSHSDGRNEPKPKNIPCPVCGLLLAKNSLKGHMMAHRGERPHVCNICGKAFAIKGNLTSHEKLHSNAAPFKCEFCGKTFKRKDYMENHRRIHTDERPFACGVCGQRFKQKGDMVRHERKHSQQKDASIRSHSDVPF